jgi:hypothetical protein
MHSDYYKSSTRRIAALVGDYLHFASHRYCSSGSRLFQIFPKLNIRASYPRWHALSQSLHVIGKYCRSLVPVAPGASLRPATGRRNQLNDATRRDGTHPMEPCGREVRFAVAPPQHAFAILHPAMEQAPRSCVSLQAKVSKVSPMIVRTRTR